MLIMAFVVVAAFAFARWTAARHQPPGESNLANVVVVDIATHRDYPTSARTIEFELHDSDTAELRQKRA
jgi:hypothetical protein